MRRIPQHLFNTLTLLSLLLFLTIAGLWARSHTLTDRFLIQDPTSRTLLESRRGSISVTRRIRIDSPSLRSRMEWITTPLRHTQEPAGDPAIGVLIIEKADRHWSKLGLDWSSTSTFYEQCEPATRIWQCIVPNWMLLPVLAIWPIRWITLLRRRAVIQSRMTRGLCGNCAYDMRATPDQCPECGTIADSSSRHPRQCPPQTLLGFVVSASFQFAVLTAAILSFSHFQTAREARAIAEARQNLRDSTSASLSFSTDLFRSLLISESKEMMTYLDNALASAIHRLQTDPDMEHPWLVYASIGRQGRDYAVFEYAFIDFQNYTEEVLVLARPSHVHSISRNLRLFFRVAKSPIGFDLCFGV